MKRAPLNSKMNIPVISRHMNVNYTPVLKCIASCLFIISVIRAASDDLFRSDSEIQRGAM